MDSLKTICMKKNLLFILSSILALTLSSCGTGFLEGMAMAMSGYNYGYGYGYGNSYTDNAQTYSSNYSTTYTPVDANTYTPSAVGSLEQFNNSFMNYTQNSFTAAQQQWQEEGVKAMERSIRLQESFKNSATWSDVPLVGGVLPNVSATGGLDYTSGTTQSTAKEKIQEYGSRYTQKDCHSCLGLKKCNTCNGKGWFYPTASSTSTDCPNCTNGNCSVCNGSGKVIGIK